LDVESFERKAREHHHAVVALLPVERHVLVAEALETLERKPVVGTLCFLRAQDVRANRFHEFGNAVDAQPHRIDVPGGNGQSHRNRESLQSAISHQNGDVPLLNPDV
jgi:hypothetical protein